MRILDEDNNKKLDCISVFLTEEEAKQMYDYLSELLIQREHHIHLSDKNFEKEITLCIYDPQKLEGLIKSV